MKENKGYIKEYDLLYGELEFEGEYLNGKRNGKGKEYYDNGKLEFEGEYLNGDRLSGKIFDIKTNMYYDSEKINGLFKEYDIYGKLRFEGEYLNGKRNGKGKEYFGEDKLSFEGEYLYGKEWDGKGYNFNNTNIEYILNKGKGYIKVYDLLYGELEFEGEYLNGKRNGKGKEYYGDGKLKFEGE